MGEKLRIYTRKIGLFFSRLRVGRYKQSFRAEFTSFKLGAFYFEGAISYVCFGYIKLNGYGIGNLSQLRFCRQMFAEIQLCNYAI